MVNFAVDNLQDGFLMVVMERLQVYIYIGL